MVGYRAGCQGHGNFNPSRRPVRTIVLNGNVAGSISACRLYEVALFWFACKRVAMTDNKMCKELFNGARNRVISHSRVGGLPRS